MALGKIPDSRYEQMSQKFEKEQTETKDSIFHLKEEFDEVRKQKGASDRFVNIVKKYTYINELDANILNELIDRIVVHHKEKDKGGNTYQQIEIYYRFIGRIKPEPDKTCYQCEPLTKSQKNMPQARTGNSLACSPT